MANDIDGNPRAATPDIGADEFIPILNFSLGPDTALCSGDTLMLFAGAPSDTVLWNTGDTTNSIMVTTPGTYSVSVNGACGSGSDAITVTQSNLTYSNFLVSDTNEICSGDTVTLSSNRPADTYSWTGGSTGSSLKVTASGTYTLDITDNCGSGSESITINYLDPPTASFTHATSFLTAVFTFNGTANGNPTYNWDFGDGTGTSTLQDPIYVYGNPGTYVVSLTVTNECGADSFTDSVIVQLPTGIEEKELFEGVQVYPNPTQGAFQLGLDLGGTHTVTYQILNLQGQPIRADDLGRVSGLISAAIDLTGRATGVYFVKVQIDDQIVVRKLVLK